jgi:hypothetical protein
VNNNASPEFPIRQKISPRRKKEKKKKKKERKKEKKRTQLDISRIKSITYYQFASEPIASLTMSQT